MTKPREPLSIEDAIMKVMVGLGREKAAAVVGKSVTHVYRWTDPDHDTKPNCDQMMKLDAAYVAAGLGEAPILRAYQAILEAASTAPTIPLRIAQ
ncbi:hypothetical protein [Pararhodospirillum photometricum]|nr:hypothetical protein [Pararhodospirillum photometricum]